MVHRYSILLITTILSILTSIQITAGKITTVPIFRRDETELHKYSAVLAAIEPYRLQLIDEIKSSLNPISYLFHKLKGMSDSFVICVYHNHIIWLVLITIDLLTANIIDEVNGVYICAYICVEWYGKKLMQDEFAEISVLLLLSLSSTTVVLLLLSLSLV